MNTETILLKAAHRGLLNGRHGQSHRHVVKYVANTATGVRDSAYKARLEGNLMRVEVILSREHKGASKDFWKICINGNSNQFVVINLAPDDNDVSVVLEYEDYNVANVGGRTHG